MPKSIYVQFLSERPNSNSHYLNRLIKLLNHFISIEPPKKTKGYEDHHIVPKAKSWKPEWDKIPENHLKVPAKAHYVIHHLMWKAFPKDHAMIKAFYRMRNGQQKQKITAKIYEVLKIEFSEAQRENCLKQVSDGTHTWLGGKNVRERVANGTHNFLGGEIQKQSNQKRLADGTHHWLGSELNNKRVANGTHPFLGGEVSKKTNARRIADGTHHFLDSEFQRQINLKRVANGTHPFLGGEVSRKAVLKQLKDGIHSSQIKKT